MCPENTPTAPVINALVLYKNRPARVKNQTGNRVEIELNDSSSSVRPKDFTLLHPGPITSTELGTLDGESLIEGDVHTAWDLVHEGGPVDLCALSELLFEQFTPQTAWTTWKLVSDGLLFEGSPHQIVARSPDAVTAEREQRATVARERNIWDAFIARLHNAKPPIEWTPDDMRFLSEIEQHARSRRDDCRVLRALKTAECPENAHALLLKTGHWGIEDVPYADRHQLDTSLPTDPVGSASASDERVDLTHLPAFAIDDEGNRDPDDAVSFDATDGSLWVHVADVGAVVHPDSTLDLKARSRGATLYQPEQTVPMLPEEVTSQFGLGLQARSPALSFHLHLDERGEVSVVDIALSVISAERLTYGEADRRIEGGHPDLTNLTQHANHLAARRRAAGCLTIEWPEVTIGIDAISGHTVSIQPLVPYQSRSLVAELMIMAGEACAQFAVTRGLPFPYVRQNPYEADDSVPATSGLSGAFSSRKRQQPARSSCSPAKHAGLGLFAYSRVTSPLRRYLDLVAHQQLRFFLKGEETLKESDIVDRIGAAEAVVRDVRRVERLSRNHWTLVYLQQHPQWQGEAIVLERRRSQTLVVIPDLAFEANVYIDRDVVVNEIVALRLVSIDLPRLSAQFELT